MHRNLQAVASRVKETITEEEQSQASTMVSVRNCLQLGDYEKAEGLRRQLITEHGFRWYSDLVELFKEYPPPPTECPDCGEPVPYEVNDSGRFYQNECQACEYKRIKAKLVSDLPEIMRINGVPKRYWKASLDDFPPTYQKLELGNSYYICGPRGVGKSHLLSALYRQLVLDKDPEQHTFKGCSHPVYAEFDNYYHDFPYFISAPELLLKIRSTFGGRSGNSEEEIIRKFSDKPVLFIDDLGAENASDWAVSVMFLLIDRRYNNELQTLITSNYSLNGLASRLDDRISSRIAELCTVLKMTGADRRLKK